MKPAGKSYGRALWSAVLAVVLVVPLILPLATEAQATSDTTTLDVNKPRITFTDSDITVSSNGQNQIPFQLENAPKDISITYTAEIFRLYVYDGSVCSVTNSQNSCGSFFKGITNNGNNGGSVNWDTSGSYSGVYLLRVTANSPNSPTGIIARGGKIASIGKDLGLIDSPTIDSSQNPLFTASYNLDASKISEIGSDQIDLPFVVNSYYYNANDQAIEDWQTLNIEEIQTSKIKTGKYTKSIDLSKSSDQVENDIFVQTDAQATAPAEKTNSFIPTAHAQWVAAASVVAWIGAIVGGYLLTKKAVTNFNLAFGAWQVYHPKIQNLPAGPNDQGINTLLNKINTVSGIAPLFGQTTAFQGQGVFAQIILNIINWLFELTFAVGVVAIVWAGILLLTSFGNEEKMATAKRTILWAAIGLVLALGSARLVNWIADIIAKRSI